MKSKILVSVLVISLVLILAIFLSGCEIITPGTDKAKIKDTLQNYASAMNNQDWDEAKSYCIYDSWAWWMVDTIEYFADYYEVFAYKIDRIQDIEVEGNYGQATIYIISTLGAWWEYIYLQKINSIWKLYSSYAYFPF